MDAVRRMVMPAEGAPIGPDEFRNMMARWVTGVAVVTCSEGGRPVGCTVNALAAVSLTPPLLLVSLSTVSRTLAAIGAHGRFVLNLLSLPHSGLGHHFARTSRDDRFAGVDFTWVQGLPVLDGAMLGVICAVAQRIVVADHVLVIAEALSGRDGEQRDPAVFFQRSYWRLSDVGEAG